jgi:hypothetical protein
MKGNPQRRIAAFGIAFRSVVVVLSCVICVHMSLVLAQLPGREGQPSKREAHREANVKRPAKSGPVDVRKLIDVLENHNRKPRYVDRGSGVKALFDKKYDWSEQERVERAIQNLMDHSEEAWAELLKHMDDRRYCITYEVSGDAVNEDVGGTCRSLVVDSLAMAYIGHIPHESSVAWSNLRIPEIARGDNAKLIAWCRKRSDKKLYELQIEMCEWAIRAVADLDVSEEEVSEKDREKSIAEIKAQIETLRKRKKAVKVNNLFWGDTHYYTRDMARKVSE